MCGGICLFHFGVLHAIKWKGWEAPSVLVFPRIELIVITAATPGVTRAAVLICATGKPAGVALGIFVLLAFPVALLAFGFYIVKRRVVNKESAVVRWVPNTDEPEGIYKYLPRAPGEWEGIEGKEEGFVDGYGLFFEDFRASSHMSKEEIKEIEAEEKEKERLRKQGELSDSDEEEEEEEPPKKKKKKKSGGGWFGWGGGGKGDEEEEEEEEEEKTGPGIWNRLNKAAKNLVVDVREARERISADYWTVLCVMYCGIQFGKTAMISGKGVTSNQVEPRLTF